MKRFGFLIILIALVSTACVPRINDFPTPPPNFTPASPPTAKLGEEFTVKSGSSPVSVDNGGMEIHIYRIVSDSRCPLTVECVEQGPVVLEFQVSTADITRQQITLSLLADKSDPATVGDYWITLVSVDPYPQNPDSLRPGDYTATLIVTKCESGAVSCP